MAPLEAEATGRKIYAALEKAGIEFINQAEGGSRGASEEDQHRRHRGRVWPQARSAPVRKTAAGQSNETGKLEPLLADSCYICYIKQLQLTDAPCAAMGLCAEHPLAATERRTGPWGLVRVRKPKPRR